jgi:hypothetical protein
MKLYHYTQRKNLFGIATRGLTPTPNDDFMTLWQPVVWLTTQETLKPTEADLAHFRTMPGYREGDDARFAEAMLLDVDVRLTVKIPTPDKRLVHYCTWMNEMGHDILEATNPAPTARKHWWLYLGTIKPSRIDLKLTPALALPGIESNIASAIEKGDDDRIADLTALREQIRAAPADALLRLMCSDKKLRQ